MRYRLHHFTGYAYAHPVDLASHMLHLTPRPLPHQLVESAELTAVPVPTRQVARRDHFGNGVVWMFLDAPHQRFEVTLDAVIRVAFPPPPAAGETLPWEQAARAARWSPAAAEFVFDSPMAAADLGAGAYAALSFPAGRPVLAGLLDLIARIRTEFAFKAGVTTIATPVARVLAQRAGVCQDFTHLMIAGLRALGLPARYVSGYIRTRPAPGRVRLRGSDQSHAWVQCWLGEAHGWVDLDPTNNLVASEEHVVLAWGRDYGDISPVRGLILGGGAHSVTVGVDLEEA